MTSTTELQPTKRSLSGLRTSSQGVRRPRRRWSGVLWVAPAMTVYAVFVLWPLSQTVRFSFYRWDGIGPATWAGVDNYFAVFSRADLLAALGNAFVLIIFFTVIPIAIGLCAAILIQDLSVRFLGATSRVLIFLPQVIPLAGAAIVWVWMYSDKGVVNQLLRAVGLQDWARPWLADFSFALPAVGVIGTWVAVGLCTLLFGAGIGRIDPTLYEAASLDGAGRFRRALSITLPELRSEIVIAATVLIIASLSSFDIIYLSTAGGPGYTTMVPGVMIYRLVFTTQQVGVASALGVVLTLITLVVVVPLQRLARTK